LLYVSASAQSLKDGARLLDFSDCFIKALLFFKQSRECDAVYRALVQIPPNLEAGSALSQ